MDVTEVKEYPHYFSTWEGYPRVHYFQSRYIDLHSRFKNLMKALPERFHVQSLMNQRWELSVCLGNFLQVTVIGKEDIYPGNLIVSDKALEKHADLPGSSPTGRIHIIVCYTKVRTLNEAAMQDISSAVKHTSKGFLDKCQGLRFVLIVCETNTDVDQNEADMFRSKLQQIVEKMTDVVDILVGQKGDSLATTISNMLEKEIMEGFNEIFTFLQRFTRKDIRYDQVNMEILKHDTVENEIRGFFRNGLALVDVTRFRGEVPIMEIILETLCSKILCAAVAPMATKYNLPDWVCHGLLDELHFSKDLKESISRNTMHHLKKFEEYIHKLEREMIESETGDKPHTPTRGICHSFDFILYQLQKGMAEPVKSAESKLSAMNRVTIVIRKMMFEIRGYLKQTTVNVDVTEIGPREMTSEDITDELQKNIMRTTGVYGMGTLFGQLEIHLKKDMQDAEVTGAKETLAGIMKKLQFHHPYIVKTVENGPAPLARSFFEQGDKISSAFPDNEKQCREGTLGCFVKGSDGFVYGLTCAHVIDPHNKEKHDVYIKKGGSSVLLAVSSPGMIYYGTQENGLNLADCAAIKVLTKVEDKCSCPLKDEFGNTKPARIATESTSDLVGSYVYKFGASTELTKGIIASNSYIIGQTPNEHLLLVEALPELSEDISGMFTIRDSETPPSSQTSNASADNSRACKNIPDLTELLTWANDDHSQNASSSDMQNLADLQEGANVVSVYTSKVGNRDVCMKLPSLQPRPESVHECENRDSETINLRNPNEIQSAPLSYSITAGPFAEQGDSGSIVCKTDLQNDEIVVLSMITAGEFTFKEDSIPSQIASDKRKYVSVRLDQVLPKLGKRSGVEFSIN